MFRALGGLFGAMSGTITLLLRTTKLDKMVWVPDKKYDNEYYTNGHRTCCR